MRYHISGTVYPARHPGYPNAGFLHHRKGVPIGIIAIELALLASMGGYDTGQISDILLMKDFLLRFSQCKVPGDVSSCNFSMVRKGLIVALLSVGTFIGALVGAPIADNVGRRRAISFDCLIFSIGVIIQITTERGWYQYAVGRLISGFGVGGLSAVVPIYQAETAPPQIRAFISVFITFGIVVAYAISIGARSLPGPEAWRVVVGIGLIWSGVLGIGIFLMPESPRWCAFHGHWDKCARSIARISGLSKEKARQEPTVQSELRAIHKQIEQEKTMEKATWLDCFREKRKTRYRTLLGMTLQSLQQLTGANYFFYYGATVFLAVGIEDSFITQLILGAVNFVCTFLGLYIMEKFGRRRPLIIGGLWQAAWLFVFAGAGTAKNPQGDKTIGTVMIVSACLFILGYASTWAPGVWIIIGETFPTRSRAKQASLSTSCNWLWNFLIAFFTPFITSAIQFKYGFVFAASNLAGAVVVYLFLYEPKGLSLEDVDRMYNDPNIKAWSSRGWVPPPCNGNGNNGNGSLSSWENGNGKPNHKSSLRQMLLDWRKQ
ncbi:general substrate transporter [Hysterangium stoloniferum]|nr:general substrate transporter [Hysterangium stoloniferum]